MTDMKDHPFNTIIDVKPIETFRELLGKKISSITIEDDYGITDIGLEDGIHLVLTAIGTEIVGEVVNVSK